MTSYLYSRKHKLIVVTVISDLVTDYRVHKICQSLHQEGYRVLLIGRHHPLSPEIRTRDYPTVRLKTLFRSTFLFYLEFNIRLFIRLLREKPAILLGNDLDVMPATLLAARIKKTPVVYDTHEFFLGMAGMDRKPVRRAVWKWIESRTFSRLKHIYTVSDSIGNLYRKIYLKKVLTVRNLPLRNSGDTELSRPEKSWINSVDNKIPDNRHILIFQGAGINESRGAEELVYSMLFLEADKYHLVIVGGGDVMIKLERIIEQNYLASKVTLNPKVPFSVLGHFTRKAHIGISIDKGSVLNHRYSLPNKLFEYLHAGIPVLASRLTEQEKIIKQYDVGTFIENHQPEHIAERIRAVFSDPETMERWKRNCCRVKEELNWENESKKLIDIFKQVENESLSR